MRRLPLLLAFGCLSWQPANAQQDANALFRQALGEQQAGQFEAAVRDYRQLLAIHPESNEVRINLGAALAGLGRFDQAIAEYQKVLSANPQNEGVRLNLALAFYKKSDFKSAIEPLRMLHQAHPGDLRTAVLLADCLRQTGEAKAAVQLLAPLANNAHPPDFDLVYGQALLQAGDKQHGLDLLEQAGRAGPSAYPLLLAGTTALDLNQLDRGRTDLEAALKLEPDLPNLKTMVGEARERTGDVEASKTILREALARNPDDFQANLTLGAILYKERDLNQAQIYLTRAVKLNPNSTLAEYELGLLQVAQGSIDEGVKSFEQVCRRDPKWLEPHVQLAALYYKLHKPDDGARERRLVDQLRSEQQQRGPQ